MGIIKEVDIFATSIQDAVDQLKIPVKQFPTICTDAITKDPYLRKTWVGPTPSKNLVFLTLPQGDFFKNILSLVATIALTIFAPYAAGLLAGTLGITSTIGIQLLQAGIVLAGSFLIGTFLTPSTTPQNKSASASPTYSISGSGNSARLFEAITKLYGEHMLYPDYAANPYSEYVDNQQYLNQLFCHGLGEYQIHELRIEDTPFWDDTTGYLDSFSGITIEIVPPGGNVTLFHSQVITSVEVGGQDLYNWEVNNSFTFTSVDKKILSNGSASKETRQFRFAVAGQRIRVPSGLNAGIYTISDIATDYTWITVVESIVNETIILVIEIEDTENWIGPYIANPADTVTNKLQIDWVFPSGMFYTSDSGSMQDESCTLRAEAQLIDTAGLPIGSWFALGQHTYTRRTVTPQRITETYNVSDGRYRVRARRVTSEDPSSRKRSSVQWNALKAFIPNDNIYPDVTLIAMRMLATGQLTQSSSKKVNSIQTAKLPIWNPNTNVWSAPTATRSIAWAAADIIRNSTYGANFDSDYIDLDALVELDETWTARGDTFNAVFDTTNSIWEALTMALRCGRAIPVMIGGKLTFVRDELRSIPRGVFHPGSIRPGSFQTQHILFDDESPDDIIVQFMDARTWKQNEVQCTQVGSLSAKPERMQIFGITDRTQAWREGMFIGAVNALRRVISTFTTEMEGRLLMRGDTVTVAHDLFEQWGQFGLVEDYDPDDRLMMLSEPIDWDLLGTVNAYVMLKGRNGVGWGPVKILEEDDAYTVTLDETSLEAVEAAQGPISDILALDDDAAMTNYIIQTATTEYKNFIIVSGIPKDLDVDLTCIIEDPNVHTADSGDPPPETYPFGTGGDPNRPVIGFLSASQVPTSDPSFPTIIFSWGAASNANTYNLQISYDNTSWENVYTGPDNTFTMSVYAGELWVRVQGVNTQAGAWKTYKDTFGTGTSAPLPVANIEYAYSINNGTLQANWPAGIRAAQYRVVVYSESSPGVFNIVELSSTIEATAIQWNTTQVSDVGGPWPNIEIGVTSINSVDESVEKRVTILGVTLDPVTSLSLQAAYKRTSFTAQWKDDNATSFDVSIIIDGTPLITYIDTLNNTQQVTLADMADVGGPWRTFTVSVVAKAAGITSTATTRQFKAPNILPVTGAGGSASGFDVTLNWFQTPDNGVDKTRVYRNTLNNFGTATQVNEQTMAAGVHVTFTQTVTAGTWYYFITARDSANGAESAPVGLTVTV